MTSYNVVEYKNGRLHCIISGMGKNRGTWDADHSRSAAYRHAAALRGESWRAAAGLSYRVERAE